MRRSSAPFQFAPSTPGKDRDAAATERIHFPGTHRSQSTPPLCDFDLGRETRPLLEGPCAWRVHASRSLPGQLAAADRIQLNVTLWASRGPILRDSGRLSPLRDGRKNLKKDLAARRNICTVFLPAGLRRLLKTSSGVRFGGVSSSLIFVVRFLTKNLQKSVDERKLKVLDYLLSLSGKAL
jgi:hypothetical protein